MQSTDSSGDTGPAVQYISYHIHERKLTMELTVRFTWSWTRQVGTDMRDRLSDDVLISTRQSKSTSLGKKTTSTKQSCNWSTNNVTIQTHTSSIH